MRSVLVVILASMASTVASAQTLQVDRIEVLSYGLYSGQVVKHEERPGTPAGINTVEDRKLMEQTETIPGRVGVRFGMEFILRGRPRGETVQLTGITRFPPPGVVNAKGQKFTKSEFPTVGTIGDKAIRTYTLDHDWEVVPGIWALEFYYEGRKIGEKLFNVVRE